MEIERALQQLELLQKKLYAYHCADSSLYLDAVTTAPSDTSEGRGVAMSILAGESQKLMTCPETKALLDTLPLDFRLLSLHLVNGVDCYDSEKYFAGKTRAQAYREYAEAKAESILDWEDFDSVAHIGYVAKFSIYTGKERALVYEDAPDAFDAIFRHVIALGKCIEVNTSGYATTGDTFAHSSLIRRYIELGGENFTFGSDSHDTARDYADVERAKEMVRALGGKYQVSFEGRKAIYWKI